MNSTRSFSEEELEKRIDVPEAGKIFKGFLPVCSTSIKQLKELGYDAELCWTDFGDTAITVLRTHLETKQFNCVLIGAGIRVPEKTFSCLRE